MTDEEVVDLLRHIDEEIARNTTSPRDGVIRGAVSDAVAPFLRHYINEHDAARRGFFITEKRHLDAAFVFSGVPFYGDPALEPGTVLLHMGKI